jgi:hypothetical protein
MGKDCSSALPIAEASNHLEPSQPESSSPTDNRNLDSSAERQKRHQQAYEAFLTAVEDLFKE